MEVPEHITSWQRSSAIGAARQALFLTLCHYPEVQPSALLTELPAGFDTSAARERAYGYDTVIANMVNHDSWYAARELPEEYASTEVSEYESEKSDEGETSSPTPKPADGEASSAPADAPDVGGK